MGLTLNKKFVDADVRAGFESGIVVERERMSEHLRLLQRAVTPEDFATLHHGLLAYFAAHQTVTDEKRELRRVAGDDLQRLVARDPKPVAELVAQQAVVDDLEVLVRGRQILAHAIRCVADGVVWRALDFDRCGISVLGDGERTGRLPDVEGAGFKAELERIYAWWNDHGVLALHNDICNCVSQGDLMVLHGRWPNPDVAVDEVKAGVKAKPSVRQVSQLQRCLRLLEEGYDPTGGADGRPLRLLRLAVPYRTHTSTLASVLVDAAETGYASQQVEEGMVISAVDYRKFDWQQAPTLWFHRAPGELGWPEDDRHFQGLAMVRRMHERRKAQPYLAPVTIFPLAPDLLADLLLGSVDYSVTISAEAVEAEFADRGITARCVAGPEASQHFLRASRGDTDVTVPGHALSQMLQETMTSATLVDVVEFMLDALDQGAPPEESVMLFCDESDSWLSPAVASTG